MKYVIEIHEIELQRIAYMRFKGNVKEANTLFPTIFKSIQGKANGSPYFQYLSMDSETNTGELEVCVPTMQTPFANGVEVKETVRTKAICTTHIGTYEGLPMAYEAVYQYAREQGLIVSAALRELYIKGPGMVLKGNPKKYITEIQVPIVE